MFVRGSLLFAMLLWSLSNAVAATTPCNDLSRYTVPSICIGLPSRGAVVRSAHLVKGSDGGYCRLLGQIVSVELNADPIRFEVNLPETWNGKALQFGGAIFDGYLHESDGRRNTVLGDKGQPPRLPAAMRPTAVIPAITSTTCFCLTYSISGTAISASTRKSVETSRRTV